MIIAQIMSKLFKRKSPAEELYKALGLEDEALETMKAIMKAIDGKDKHYVIIALITNFSGLLADIKDEEKKRNYIMSLFKSLERNGVIKNMEIESVSPPDQPSEIH